MPVTNAARQKYSSTSWSTRAMTASTPATLWPNLGRLWPKGDSKMLRIHFASGCGWPATANWDFVEFLRLHSSRAHFSMGERSSCACTNIGLTTTWPHWRFWSLGWQRWNCSRWLSDRYRTCRSEILHLLRSQSFAGAWCATYGRGVSNCSYSSIDQCLATVRGLGGFCAQIVPRQRLRDLLRELECPDSTKRYRRPICGWGLVCWSLHSPGSNIPGPLPPAVSGRSSAIVNRSGAIVHVL